jgi:hypothetical protein
LGCNVAGVDSHILVVAAMGEELIEITRCAWHRVTPVAHRRALPEVAPDFDESCTDRLAVFARLLTRGVVEDHGRDTVSPGVGILVEGQEELTRCRDACSACKSHHERDTHRLGRHST